MEIKALPALHVKSVQDRTVTGIFSVFGNVDSVGDIVWPGAFAKSMADGGVAKTLHLWQHDPTAPPIAVIKGLREVGRGELPADVQAAYPDALGGAEVTREYLDTSRGNEVLAAIKAGAPMQASFAFDPLSFDFTTAADDTRIRNLRQVRLWETSDVNWGANDATRASKAALDLDQLVKRLRMHLAEQKTGARHSAADIKQLNSIHDAVMALGATNCPGGKDAPEPADESAAKSRAAVLALTPIRQTLAALELSLLSG